jgi:hypothetical protein
MKETELEILDLEKLETILVSRWTEFIDIKKLRQFVVVEHNPHDCSVIKLTLSRCYLTPQGFIIWIESTVRLANQPNPVNITIEALLKFSGQIIYITSI